MARRFTKNTSNYLVTAADSLGNLLHGAAAFSFHMWARYSSIGAVKYENGLFNFNTGGGGSGLFVSVHDGTSAKIVMGGRSQMADGFQERVTTGAMTSDTWAGIGGVFNIAGDTITPYLNGVADNGGSVTFGAGTYTHTNSGYGDQIGYWSSVSNNPASTGNQWAGDIGEIAFWLVALNANEMAALARGCDPMQIRGGPVFWLPLWGTHSPEIELRSNKVGTITGTVAAAPHAPVTPFFCSCWAAGLGLAEAGLQTLTIGVATATAAAVAPTLSPGSVSLDPGVAASSATAVAPTLSPTSTVTPGVALATCSAIEPTLSPGQVTLTPGAAVCTASAVEPTMSNVASLSVGIATATASCVAPTLSPGSTTLTIGVAVATAVGINCTIQILVIADVVEISRRVSIMGNDDRRVSIMGNDARRVTLIGN